jgi:hypothetical protein
MRTIMHNGRGQPGGQASVNRDQGARLHERHYGADIPTRPERTGGHLEQELIR